MFNVTRVLHFFFLRKGRGLAEGIKYPERRGGGGVADDNRRRNKNGDSAAERVANDRAHTHPHAPNLGQQIAGWDARGLPAATAPEGSFDDEQQKSRMDGHIYM
ncbi:unnamed protein product [Macrosiphum euphorbiae]|uniref:Uncharacterized protein n=1 Tax=Macrosiphum euphorbiae TaxID=13131 RepID=A0AAV0VYJ1_9HEMI|nr:unnamed protein product [Macrosiphum euphorbiae]